MSAYSKTEPWMPAGEYGKSLKGLSINLLVTDVGRAVDFCRGVLGAEVLYADVDFAALRFRDAEWMLHADHTYDKHPMYTSLTNGQTRGVGTEIRLHGCDPDRAESRCRELGFRVLQTATDKPHGLREAFLLDPDGYVWVPDCPLA